MKGRLPVLALLAVAAAGPAQAQTSDVFYRSWRWSDDPGAARAAGLAGAVAAVDDDAAAAEANPAALATLSKVELAFGFIDRARATSALGDELRPRRGLGFAALAGRLSERWAVGAYYTQPHAVEIDLASLTSADGTREEGRLDALLTEAGASAALGLTSRLRLGARVGAARLQVAGDYSRATGGRTPGVVVESAGERTRVEGTLGLLYEANRHLQLALVRSTGARFTLPRRAESPLLGFTLDSGSGYEVAQPSVFSGAFAARPSPRLLLAGQLDYVRYGELEADGVSGGYAARAFALYAWEPRAAAELSLPLSRFSLQLRGGVHVRGRGTVTAEAAALASTPPLPVAMPIPPPLAGQAPSAEELIRISTLSSILSPASAPEGADARRVVHTWLGASAATTRGLRFDLAARFGPERPIYVAGCSLRF